jgi:hypothetical protein
MAAARNEPGMRMEQPRDAIDIGIPRPFNDQ